MKHHFGEYKDFPSINQIQTYIACLPVTSTNISQKQHVASILRLMCKSSEAMYDWISNKNHSSCILFSLYKETMLSISSFLWSLRSFYLPFLFAYCVENSFIRNDKEKKNFYHYVPLDIDFRWVFLHSKINSFRFHPTAKMILLKRGYLYPVTVGQNFAFQCFLYAILFLWNKLQ